MLLEFLVPSLCAACRAACPPAEILCEACVVRLDAVNPAPIPAPPQVDACWSAAPYEGIARELVGALKFGRLLPVAGLIAERIAVGAPPALLSQPLVPVPPDPLRGRMRGFDPAEEIAVRLAEHHGPSAWSCLARARGRRQVGRRRSERLSRSPRVRAVSDIPPRVTLVDDVVTTGATLSGCAQALRAAGAERVDAIAFARAL